MARRTKTTDTIRFDREAAEQAFQALAEERARLGPDVPAAPRLDLQAVAVLALRVAAELAKAPVHQRFENISKELPIETVDVIGTAGWALWYATVQRATAVAGSSRALLPEELISRAFQLRATMLKVVQYHLDEDAKTAAEINDIISGTGYADLASDLQRLSHLYRAHREALQADSTRYRADDEPVAAATAGEIVRALAGSENEELGRWTSDVNRSYAVLNRAYQRVRLFALALFGEEGEDRVPSLFSVRAPARPAPIPSDPPAEGPTAPATPETVK